MTPKGGRHPAAISGNGASGVRDEYTNDTGMATVSTKATRTRCSRRKPIINVEHGICRVRNRRRPHRGSEEGGKGAGRVKEGLVLIRFRTE
jgi:hypothetical protein